MSEQTYTLITGASEGIGKCFAEVFAKKGHNLILVARSEQKLQEIAQHLIHQYSISVEVIAADLIPQDAAENLFLEVAKRQLHVDTLVNNAGMMQVEEFCISDMEVCNSVMSLNVMSVVNLTRLFSGPMLSSASGKIINVGSIASFMPTPNFSVYGASKAFILSFSEGLSQELKGSGVSVTCVCPGFTKTDMLSHAQGMEKFIPKFLKADPMQLAEQAYQASMKGEVVFLDSLANKMLVQWASHYPRWLVRGINGLFSRLS